MENKKRYNLVLSSKEKVLVIDIGIDYDIDVVPIKERLQGIYRTGCCWVRDCKNGKDFLITRYMLDGFQIEIVQYHEGL